MRFLAPCSSLLLVAPLILAACDPATIADAGTDGALPDADRPLDAEVAPDAAVLDAATPDDTRVVSIDAPTADVPPGPATFGNVVAPCAAPDVVQPVMPEELGHYAAARLTPPTTPFVVERISYALRDVPEFECDAALGHDVLLFVGGTAPDASPSSEVQHIDVPPAPGLTERPLDLALPTPVRLEAGQSLYVAVQLNGDTTSAMCLASCGDGPAIEGVDFWSNATTAPFAWADLVGELGLPTNLDVHAQGFVP